LVGVPHPGGIHIILMVKQTTRRMSCLVFLTFVASVLTVGQAQLLLDNMFRFPRPGFEGEIRSKKPLQTLPTRPPHEQKALTARYLVHVYDWGSLATISSQNKIAGLPYANIFSIADGVVGNVSGGIPYFFMTPMDVSAQDLVKNPSATLVVSEAQGGYCKQSHLDPESPVCARVIITGHIEKLSGGEEMLRARHYLFTRHPSMATWPSTHKWFFSKLNIKHIQLLDYYGGISNVPLKDYYETKLYPV